MAAGSSAAVAVGRLSTTPRTPARYKARLRTSTLRRPPARRFPDRGAFRAKRVGV